MSYLGELQKVMYASNCKLTVCPMVLSKRGCIVTLFCLVTAIISPCFVEIFLFAGGEVQPKNHHGFHLSGERVLNDPKFTPIASIDTVISLVERQYNIKEGLLEVGCSFLELFSVRNAHSSEITNKCTSASEKEIKKVVNATLAEIRHKETPMFPDWVAGIVGFIGGSLIFILGVKFLG